MRRVLAGVMLVGLASLWWGAVKPFPWRVERELTYAEDLALDLYHPPKDSKPAPLVVLLHGGGWHSGDKRQVAPLAYRISKAGYSVAAVNFRLAPAHQFPAPLEDLGAALEYLQARPDLDTSRVALVGMSSGGHLASLYALKAEAESVRGHLCFCPDLDQNRGGFRAPGEGDEAGLRGSGFTSLQSCRVCELRLTAAPSYPRGAG